MSGPCHDADGAGYCRMKGNSQSLKTLVSATDELDFELKPRIGSFALFFLQGKVVGQTLSGMQSVIRLTVRQWKHDFWYSQCS